MKYFSIAEMVKSDTATKYKISNTPTEEIATKLTALIDNILDPLREAYGKPITISSGYRCGALNAKVGGASNSQHLSGEAADITVGTKDGNKVLFNLIRQLNLPFDQLINENNYQWVHVSYGHRNRRQVLNINT
jgi:uncharacterized protein YcbK (DUF882 family)